jgi:hypothetical protein
MSNALIESPDNHGDSKPAKLKLAVNNVNELEASDETWNRFLETADATKSTGEYRVGSQASTEQLLGSKATENAVKIHMDK